MCAGEQQDVDAAPAVTPPAALDALIAPAPSHRAALALAAFVPALAVPARLPGLSSFLSLPLRL